MLNLGLTSKYLGLEFKQRPHVIFLHQRLFNESLPNKFGMLNYNPSNIPLVESLKLQLDMNFPTYYKSLVGKLIFFTNTRLDIAFMIKPYEWIHVEVLKIPCTLNTQF
jgi:hypothetical protein